MLGRFAAKHGRRFEVPSEKGERVGRLRGWPRFDDDGPATTPAEVMETRRSRRGVREDMSVAGRRKEPGAATRGFQACVGIWISGIVYQIIGTLMVRFQGFGGFFITLGAVMVIIGTICMLLTPLVWAISAIGKALSRDERPAW